MGASKDYHRVAKGCKLKKEAMKFEDSFLAREFCEDLEQMRASISHLKRLTEMYLREKQGGTKNQARLPPDKYMF